MVLAAMVGMGVVPVSTGQASAQTLPAGPGRDKVQQSCTSCHVATQFTSKLKTADQWSQTVETMISNGAKISDTDFDTIVAYLTAHYGVAKTAAVSEPGAATKK
jgi:mono/diheme cytochrome c family protein